MRAGIACSLLACIGVLRLPDPPGTAAITGAGVLGLLALLLAVRRRDGQRAGLLLLAWVLCSAAWTGFRLDAALDDRLDAPPSGTSRVFTAVVVDLPEVSGRVTRLLVRPDPDQGLPDRIRLNWYGEGDAPRAAERWSFEAKLRPPQGFANPHGFDYGAWLLQHRIGATGYVREGPDTRRLASADWRHAPLTRLRDGLRERLEAATEPRDADAVTALLIGHGGDAERRSVLRATGTAHLFAISGLHLAMASFWFHLLASTVWASAGAPRGIPPRTVGLVAALAAGLVYLGLAGASLPTQRAALMLAVATGAWLFARPVGPGRALATALGAVLIMDPLSPLDPGFWLSFLAVAAILWTGAGRPGRRPPLIRIQFAITLALAPAVAWLSRSAVLASLPANLVAVPVFSLVILPGVFLGGALAAIHPAAGGWLLVAADRAMAVGLEGLGALASVLPPTPLPEPTPVAMLCAGIGAFLAVAPRGWPGRVLWPTMFLPLLWPASDTLPRGAFTATFLDVGQGMAVVVETRHHTLVYDAGPSFGSGSDTGELVVIPHLSARGRSVDRIVLSHDDDDHGGGIRSLRAAYPGAALIAGGGEVPPGAVACRRGMDWQEDGVRFRILHPAEIGGKSGNDASCVLRISGPGGSLLLTGDIERGAERLLAAAPIRADVVSIPHHGSATSSSPRFVEAVDACIAVAAAGRGNRWGFPRPQVAQRWQAAGARVLVTGRDGAVTLGFHPGADPPSVHRVRVEGRRAWMRAPEGFK